MQDCKPYQVGSPNGVPVIMVRSTDPIESYQHGGKNYGYKYEYGINLYCFEREKPYRIMDRLGLDEEQYYHWLGLLRKVVDEGL